MATLRLRLDGIAAAASICAVWSRKSLPSRGTPDPCPPFPVEPAGGRERSCCRSSDTGCPGRPSAPRTSSAAPQGSRPQGPAPALGRRARFRWMTVWKRLVRHYERRLDVSEAMIHVAPGGLMPRRIVHPRTLSNALLGRILGIDRAVSDKAIRDQRRHD